MNITKPTLIIDKDRCLKNIHKMSSKAKKHNLSFRPHFKTHQLVEVGEWFQQSEISEITVSSIEMAEYFANNGWLDITIAFPLNIREIDKINKLAQQIKLNILIDSFETAVILGDKIKHPFGLFIELDSGYRRTGVDISNNSLIDKILSKLVDNEFTTFNGFLIHSGNTYNAKSKDEILTIHQNAINGLHKLKSHYTKYFKNLVISIGDTPSCSLAENFENIDEIRPGNFVYYDWMQYELGTCSLDEIAVLMCCPVVGKYPERNEIVIHGGAVHFSKDSILNKDRTKNFGQLVNISNYKMKISIENCYLSSISQEHGIIKCTNEFIKQINIGDLVYIIPIHSCLTMNLMKENYLTV